MPRTCDACRECCIYVKVDALAKPRGEACEHLLPVLQSERGCCGIYDQRPEDCKAFKCSWLDGTLPDDLKPDVCHCVLETTTIDWPKRLTVLTGCENKPGAFARYRPKFEASTGNGVILFLMPYFKNQPMIVMGDGVDMQAWMTFLAKCKRDGAVGYISGSGEVTIEEFEQ